MLRYRQFSLRYLLVELTLIASLAGAIRLVFVRSDNSNAYVPVVVSMAAAWALPILCGAVIGGFFGKFKAGALLGAGVFGLLLFAILTIALLAESF